MVPLACQKGLHLGPATGELDAVTPHRIGRVGKRHLGGVAAVPAVFGEADFFDGGFAVEGGQRWAGHRRHS
ncbi:hypothetical protein D3C79_1010840 [compost metagenome]